MRLHKLLPAALLLLSPVVLSAQQITLNTLTTNLSAGPITYQFSFGTPITPQFYNTLFLDLSADLDNGATVAPWAGNGFYLNAFGRFGATETFLGAFGTGGCADTDPINPTTCTLGPTGGATFSFAGSFFDQLHLELEYSSTGVQGTAAFDGIGRLSNTVVPEPSTYLLMASGLLAVGALRVRRRG